MQLCCLPQTYVHAQVVWVSKMKSRVLRLRVFGTRTTSLIRTELGMRLFRLARFYTCTRTCVHTHTHTNGQMLSPPRLSTSTLRSVAEIASPASRDRASMRYMESWGQRYNPPRAWPESSKGTDNGTALGLDTKTHTYPSAA